MSSDTWSLRGLLSPVIARLLILGVPPFDLEAVLRRIEGERLLNAKMLEARWLSEWASVRSRWAERGRTALARGHTRTACTCRFYAAACGLARFLVNTGDLELKKAVYLEYARSHREYLDLESFSVEEAELVCAGGRKLAAQLYLPRAAGPHPCVLVLSGLGSCKEEMITLARPLVDRGMAALVPDTPGCGATLFAHDTPCSMELVELAIHALAESVGRHPALDASALGVTGLCMGGGYAFRAAAIEPRVRFAATLFPLFIDRVAVSSVPQWMRSGAWLERQIGAAAPDDFVASMGLKASDVPRVPTLLVHGRHDNWMTWESATALLARVDHPRRDLLEIEEEPAITGGNATTHAMPVGEQMHWVAPHAADWMEERVAELRP